MSNTHNVAKTDYVVCKAVCYNDISYVKYMYLNGYKFDTNSINYAARNGYIDIFKYLHSNGIKHSPEIINDVIKNNHIEMANYIHKINKICIKHTTYDEHMIKTNYIKYMNKQYKLAIVLTGVCIVGHSFNLYLLLNN